MKFLADRPIYLQIMDLIIQQIVSNQLLLGAKVQSVRELATELTTNPSTVQRALQELERAGVIHSKRGLGRYVTEDVTKIAQLKQTLQEEVIASFLEKMQNLGWSNSEAASLLYEYLERKI